MADAVPTIVVTSAGAVPTPPATLRASLVAGVAATNPGYTDDLPGSLVEDIASTDTGALVVCDSAAVDSINSISPYTANAFILSQIGQVYIGQGSAPATPTNTSVNVTFHGTPGWVIAKGFTVSDGTYQYIVQNGGVIASDGFSEPLFCLAPNAGSWAVPTNTVTALVTSVPSDVELTCTNQTAGVPGAATAESEESYRARVMDAAQAVSIGMPPTLRRNLSEVSGVQTRLVSVRQQPGGGWEVIVGGGDPYEVANAIFDSMLDVSTLTGSVLSVTNITNAADALVTTDLNHGYTDGQQAVMTQVVGMTPVNNVEFTVAVVTEKSFHTGINSLGFPAYVSGGVVSPNLRNEVVSINDFPDIYAIPFVNPPQQTVAITVTWNTSSPNFVSGAAVSQLGNPALVAYVNGGTAGGVTYPGVSVGQPLNLFEMQTVFQTAIAAVLAPDLLTRLVFAVSINGVGVDPSAGTGIYEGDPESYFLTTAAQVVITQG